MKRLLSPKTKILTSIFLLFLLFGFSFNSQAHCDRANGPVAVAAKKALEKGDVSYALIWIGNRQEEELKSKFTQSLQVYRKGGKSQELATRYLM